MYSVSINAVLALLGIFFCPVAMVILITWFKYNSKNKQDKLRAELMIKAIEHGQTIPDNFFEEKKEEKNSLKKGIIWTSAGLGIVSFFVLIGLIKEQDAFAGTAIGSIPTFIGIGYLLYNYLVDRQEKSKENDSDK